MCCSIFILVINIYHQLGSYQCRAIWVSHYSFIEKWYFLIISSIREWMILKNWFFVGEIFQNIFIFEMNYVELL